METAAVRHYPTVTKKHRNKGYFDQNNTFRIPNVTNFVVYKAYIIADREVSLYVFFKVQK